MAGYDHYEEIVSSPCYTLSCHCWANMGDDFLFLRVACSSVLLCVSSVCSGFLRLLYIAACCCYLSKCCLTLKIETLSTPIILKRIELNYQINTYIHIFIVLQYLLSVVAQRLSCIAAWWVDHTYIQSVTTYKQTDKKEIWNNPIQPYRCMRVSKEGLCMYEAFFLSRSVAAQWRAWRDTITMRRLYPRPAIHWAAIAGLTWEMIFYFLEWREVQLYCVFLLSVVGFCGCSI